MKNILKQLEEAKVVAVISVDNADNAVDLVNALKDGGIKAIELTLRNENALECLSAVADKVEGVLIGAGTVLTPEQVYEVRKRGADFAVSPGCNRRVLKAAQEAMLPFAPGIMTPSDIELALEFDCRFLKFFPAETSGGLKHLESMSAPYKHLGIKFIPLGGLNLDNFEAYLNSSSVVAIGGSWIAPSDLVKAGDWSKIQENASRCMKKITS